MRLLLFDTHFLLCVGKKDWFSVLVGHPCTAKQLRYTLYKPYSHFQNLFTLGILEPTPECSRRINRMDFLALICGNGYQDDKQDDSDARVWFRMKLLIPEDWIQLYRITVDSARENHFFSLPCNLYPYVFATPDYRLEAFDRACQKNLYLKPSSPQHFLSQKDSILRQNHLLPCKPFQRRRHLDFAYLNGFLDPLTSWNGTYLHLIWSSDGTMSLRSTTRITETLGIVEFLTFQGLAWVTNAKRMSCSSSSILSWSL